MEPARIDLSKLKVGAIINTSSGGCDAGSEAEMVEILETMGVTNYKIRINTIGFQTGPNARDVLEKIARKFRGEFTEVD